MPLGDRTGPMGMGPMTGRAAGYCAGYGMPGYMNPMPGMGFGFGRGGFWGRGRGGGRGGGRGWRHWYYATGLPGWARGGYPFGYGAPYAPVELTGEQEMEALREHAKFLEKSLAEVKKSISDLEASAKEKK